MKDTYTPGPWYHVSINGETHVQSRILEEDNYVCKAEGDSKKQAQANARLIAAAPCLLEALENILAVVNVRIDDPRCEAFDKARQAIAKATNL